MATGVIPMPMNDSIKIGRTRISSADGATLKFAENNSRHFVVFISPTNGDCGAYIWKTNSAGAVSMVTVAEATACTFNTSTNNQITVGYTAAIDVLDFALNSELLTH